MVGKGSNVGQRSIVGFNNAGSIGGTTFGSAVLAKVSAFGLDCIIHSTDGF